MEHEITIRKMAQQDVDEVFELIRTERDMWSREEILGKMGHLYVLLYGKAIIAVLYGKPDKGSCQVHWIAVHPMYPENSIRLAFAYCLSGIFYKKPVEKPATAGRLIGNKPKQWHRTLDAVKSVRSEEYKENESRAPEFI